MMLDKIIEMLGKGYPNTVVALHCGVSESYISQLLSQEEVASKVVELKMLNLQKQTERDESYDALEDELLSKLKDSVPMLVRPLEITRVLKTVNEAKRRGAGNDGTAQQATKVVVLNMPQFVQQRFIMNERSEVVEVDGRSLATINAKTLMSQLGVPVEEPGSVTTHGVIVSKKPPPPQGVLDHAKPLSSSNSAGANSRGDGDSSSPAADISIPSQANVAISR